VNENGCFMNIDQVWVHPGPHLDDLVAALLLLSNARKKVSEVRVVQITDRDPFSESSEGELRHRGIWVIGVGGNDWDDHVVEGRRLCAADLVAKDLGLEQDPAVQRMLSAVRENDLAGRGGYMHLADCIRAMNQVLPPQAVLAWLEPVFQALYQREVVFQKALSELEESGARQIAVPFSGGIRTLLVVESDNPQIVRAVRKHFGGAFNLHIVVVRRISGQTIILADQCCTPEVVLSDLVAILRVEEQGSRRDVWEWRQLREDGTLVDVPQWHFEKRGLMILNGSDSAPRVPPTSLSLQQVVNAAILALSDLTPAGCQDPCLKRKCPLYAYGLSICHWLRRGQARKI